MGHRIVDLGQLDGFMGVAFDAYWFSSNFVDGSDSPGAVIVVKLLTLKAEMSGLKALKKRLFAGADVVRLIKRQGLGTPKYKRPRLQDLQDGQDSQV